MVYTSTTHGKLGDGFHYCFNHIYLVSGWLGWLYVTAVRRRHVYLTRTKIFGRIPFDRSSFPLPKILVWKTATLLRTIHVHKTNEPRNFACTTHGAFELLVKKGALAPPDQTKKHETDTSKKVCLWFRKLWRKHRIIHFCTTKKLTFSWCCPPCFPPFPQHFLRWSVHVVPCWEKGVPTAAAHEHVELLLRLMISRWHFESKS